MTLDELDVLEARAEQARQFASDLRRIDKFLAAMDEDPDDVCAELYVRDKGPDGIRANLSVVSEGAEAGHSSVQAFKHNLTVAIRNILSVERKRIADQLAKI